MNASAHPVAVVLLVLCASAALYQAGRFLFRRNTLLAEKDGLNFDLRLCGLTLAGSSVPWSDFVSAGLFKPPKKTNSDDWFIDLHRAHGDPIRLAFGCFTRNLDRQKLLRSFKRWAPDASID